MADNPGVGFGATYGELWTSRVVCAAGALAGLAIIPVAITARHRVFQKRIDLASDDVVLLFENFLLLKAAFDGVLCLILLAGLLVSGDSMGCKVLGFLYQFEEVCTLILLVRIAQHPFHFLLKKEDMTHTTQYFTRSVLACLVGATVVCVPLASVSDFGRTGTLCWLKSVPTQFYAFFSLVLVMWVICLSVIFRVARVTRHRYAGRLHTVYHGNFFRRLTDGMVLNLAFMAVAVVIYGYVFRLASRAYIWKFGKESAVLSFMEMITIAFRGPVDAIVYSPKDWLVRIIRSVRLWFQSRRGRAGSIKQKSSMALAAGSSVEPIRLLLLGKAYPLPFFTDPPVPQLEDRQLFISTYNLAECKSKALGPEALAAWIPKDRDVYVLGVQECMVYQQLGEDVLTHLGGPEKYVMYRRAIGSTNQALGYHGLIALLVLARREEVQANRFLLHESKTSAVARGKNLGVTVAQNKGGVGLAFRYFDTTFALLACHLSSDLKGRSRLDKRNQDAWRLTYETNLWREEYLLDVYHQHHVCVFLGDLNYRLRRTDAGKVLEDVAEICRAERDGVCGGEKEWRKKRYAALLAPREGSAATGEEKVEEEGGEGEGEKESSCVDQLLTNEKEGANGEGESGDHDDEEEEDDVDGDLDDSSSSSSSSNSTLYGVQGLVRQVKSYLSEPTSIEMSKVTMKRLTSSYLREIADGGDAPEEGEEEEEEEEDKAGPKHKNLQPVQKPFSRRQTWGGRIFSSLHQQRNSSKQVGFGKHTSSSTSKGNGDIDVEAGDMPLGLPSSSSSLSSFPQSALTPTNQQPSAGAAAAAAAAAAGGGSDTPPLPLLRGRKSRMQSRVASSQHATTWAELLRDDELKQGMDKGDLFYGFQEGEIRFPPSYRRVKGPHGECGDYTDAELLKKAFSTAVKEKTPPLQRLNRGLTKFAQSQQQQPQQQKEQQQSQIYSTTSRVPSFGSSLAESHRVNSSLRSLEVEGGGSGGGGSRGGEVSSMTTRTTTMTPSATGSNSSSSSARTTTRIPSYTDRILLHVVEDFQDRVSLGPYEMCDALLGSDHKPVSTVVTARVNVGVRGLNAFQQANEYLQDPTVVHSRDIVTVHDACLYLLELTNVRVELFAGGLTDGCKVVEEEVEEGGGGVAGRRSGRGMGKMGKGKPPRDEASVFVLFPLDNEDAFSTLRRPAIVAAVSKQIVFLTSRVEYNPFNFFSLASYGAAKQNGVTIVSCARMDYGGLHAIFSLRDGKRGQLGACVIPITGKDGKVQREQKDAVWPLTVGGCLCGHLFASLKITQLALDASTVQV